MKKNIKLSDIVFSAVLAGELAVLLDFVSVYCGRALSLLKFGLMLAVLFAVILLVPVFTRRFRKAAALAVAALVYIPLLAGVLCWHSVSENAVYASVDNGKEQLYAGQKVMLLIPHQDDDFNVLGGVMEEYVKYGSDVYVVFSTNGDYYNMAEIRFQEALNALGHIGIPEDHVIFLGYGDQWDSEGPHIYNAEPGAVVSSHLGRTETYGTQAHAVYREGREYTIENFLSDIESVILEHRPDVLYCVDYDYNIDHRALSMSFEKVMGNILKSNPDYRPLVFKGYAYNTAWEAVNDFYTENLLPTQDAFGENYEPVPAVYRWEERVRFPVSAAGLSRSVISAQQGVALSMYESQGAVLYGSRVMNSDKIFWQRHTTSLCLDADIQTSSASGAFLNDFMLLESNDLLEMGDTPYDGAWVPESGDAEKTACVTFPETEDVHTIVLYDHPDPEKNILNAVITFDDGTSVETGPLDPNGAESRFVVEKKGISSFTVTLVELEGEGGLAEIEAYAEAQTLDMPYVKFMDEDGNFAYDYWIDRSGTQTFRLYTAGGAPTEPENYTVSCDNSACSAVWENGSLWVECPVGEACVVTVTSADGTVSDSVYIRNPGALERGWNMFWLRAEKLVMELCETRRLHERLFLCRLAAKAADLLQ